MTRPIHLKKTAAALLVVVSAACQPARDGADVALTFARLPQGVGTPCPSVPSDTPEYESDQVDSLRLRISGPGMKTMEQTFTLAAARSGSVEMEKVPVGVNRNVLLTGLKGALSSWRGQARGITVEANKASEVNVLLTKVADLSCARSPLQNPRAFHAATALADGRILITGGIGQETNGTGCMPTGGQCKSWTATATADIFDPATGQVFSTGAMAHARAFHTAVALADGSVVIVGGASAAQVNTAAPFPIIPSQPVADVELFDPATNTFTIIGSDVETSGRTFAAGVLIKGGVNGGKALITGGGSPTLWTTPLPADPRTNTALALRSSLLCNAAGCLAGPDMNMRRVGHVMSTLSDGAVLVFGGSIETGTVAGTDDSGATRQVSRQAPEFFNGDAFAFPADRPLFVESSGPSNNVFFGTAMTVEGYGGVFIVGGITREQEGSGSPILFKAPEAQAWFFAEDGRFMSPGTETETWELGVPRYLLSAAPMGDGSNWAVLGGYEGSLGGFRPSDALEVFDGARAKFKQISVGGVPRTLRQARGGAPVVAIRGGTAMVVGGSSMDPSAQTLLLDTAEIYTDTVEPAP